MTKRQAIAKAGEMGFEVVLFDRAFQRRNEGYYLVADRKAFKLRTLQGVGASYEEAFASIKPFIYHSQGVAA